MPTSKQVIEEQLWLLSVSLFLREYCVFEKNVKAFYLQNINNNKEILSYFYGGKTALNVHIDTSKMNFGFNTILFDSNFQNIFSILSINHVIKIDRWYNLTSYSNDIKVTSVSKKMIQYDFYTIALALINMRNILAHENSSTSFKKECIIEILPNDILINFMNEEVIFNKSSIDDCDAKTIIVQSNLYYMKLFNKELEKFIK